MARILVVDDSPAAIAVVKALMEPEGHHVEGVTSFVDVVSTINEQPPDLLLLDLSLPAMAGRMIGSFVRKYQTAPIPILIYSGQPEDEIQAAATELGAIGSLPKGLSNEVLRDRIRTVLDSLGLG